MWGLELNALICLLLVWTTRAACAPVKVCPHKQPGNGCVLDLSVTETHGPLCRTAVKETGCFIAAPECTLWLSHKQFHSRLMPTWDGSVSSAVFCRPPTPTESSTCYPRGDRPLTAGDDCLGPRPFWCIYPNYEHCSDFIKTTQNVCLAFWGGMPLLHLRQPPIQPGRGQSLPSISEEKPEVQRGEVTCPNSQ